jgi:hypothetical protein
VELSEKRPGQQRSEIRRSADKFCFISKLLKGGDIVRYTAAKMVKSTQIARLDGETQRMVVLVKQYRANVERQA